VADGAQTPAFPEGRSDRGQLAVAFNQWPSHSHDEDTQSALKRTGPANLEAGLVTRADSCSPFANERY